MTKRIGPNGMTAFVSNGENRSDTAALLIGAALEIGLTSRDNVSSTWDGFFISDELADFLEREAAEAEEIESVYDPSEHPVKDVKEFITDNPEFAETVLAGEEAGENRATLVKWLAEFIETSGNRAEKNSSTDKE